MLCLSIPQINLVMMMKENVSLMIRLACGLLSNKQFRRVNFINQPADSLGIKTIYVTKEVYLDILVNKVVLAIKEKFSKFTQDHKAPKSSTTIQRLTFKSTIILSGQQWQAQTIETFIQCYKHPTHQTITSQIQDSSVNFNQTNGITDFSKTLMGSLPKLTLLSMNILHLRSTLDF